MRRAVDRGFVSVFLWVVAANERARDFYLRFGFIPDGETRLEAHPVEPYAASRYRIAPEALRLL